MSSNAFADSDGQGGLKRFEVHEAVGSADGVHMPVEEDDVTNLFSMDSAAGETHRMLLRFLLLIFLNRLHHPLIQSL